MRRLKRFATGSIPYIIIAALIALIFLSVCVHRHISPFGSYMLNVNSDTQQESIPHLYHLWDFLHGESPLYYQWYAGTGSSDAGIASHFSMISPFSLFLLFIERTDIDRLASLFYLIKLIFSGCGMYFFLSRYFLDNNKNLSALHIVLSVSYAINAWSMMYLSFGWTDVMAFFPFLMYFLIMLLDKGPNTSNIAGYMAFSALIYIVNLPIAYMVFLFLVLFSGAYLLTGPGGRDKLSTTHMGRCTLALILSTAGAAFISAFSWLPAAFDIIKSSRYSADSELSLISRYLKHCAYTDFFTPENLGMYEPWKKVWILLCLVPCIAGLLACRIKAGERRRDTIIFELFLLALTILPVAFTTVDFVWHFGPYQCFPMRYGFMLVFLVSFLWARAYPKAKNGLHNSPGFFPLLTIPLCCALLALSLFFTNKNITPREDHIAKDFAGLSELLENEDPEESVFTGVKMGVPVASDHNYPLIVRYRAVSQYPATGDHSQIEYFKSLGYAQSVTRNGDDGGTAFSDALMGTKYIFADKAAPENADFISVYSEYHGLYEYASENDRYILYRTTGTFPPGLTVKAKDVEHTALDVKGADNPFEYQNYFSRLLFNKVLLSEGTGSGLCYLWAGEQTGLTVDVDGVQHSPYYPYGHSNGILPLGYYPEGGEVITVRNQTGGEPEKPVSIYTLDTKALSETFDIAKEASERCDYETHRSGLDLFVKNTRSDEMLYLPIFSSFGWTCRLNGARVPITRVGNAMFLPLSDGDSSINLTWQHPLYIPALILTALGAALSLAAFIFRERISALASKLSPKALTIHAGIMTAVFAGAVLIIYVIPICIYLVIQ